MSAIKHEVAMSQKIDIAIREGLALQLKEVGHEGPR